MKIYKQIMSGLVLLLILSFPSQAMAEQKIKSLKEPLTFTINNDLSIDKTQIGEVVTLVIPETITCKKLELKKDTTLIGTVKKFKRSKRYRRNGYFEISIKQVNYTDRGLVNLDKPINIKIYTPEIMKRKDKPAWMKTSESILFCSDCAIGGTSLPLYLYENFKWDETIKNKSKAYKISNALSKSLVVYYIYDFFKKYPDPNYTQGSEVKIKFKKKVTKEMFSQEKDWHINQKVDNKESVLKMISNSAVIHTTAQIAEDVEIGPNVVIGENVKLQRGVKIVANAYLEFCEIGDNTIIHPFATIGTAPQDLGYKNEPTKVIVGKNCLIRENVTINRAANCGDFTTQVGDKCMLMTGSHVAHNCKLENEVILANLATLGGHVQVGFGTFIGGMAVVHQNVRIGELAIISGFSGARQDVLPYTKNATDCPTYAIGINIVALRRRGFSQEDRTSINEAFKLLSSKKYNTSQAIEQIEKTMLLNKYLQTMIDFIKTSKRGVSLKCHKSNME